MPLYANLYTGILFRIFKFYSYIHKSIITTRLFFDLLTHSDNPIMTAYLIWVYIEYRVFIWLCNKIFTYAAGQEVPFPK